MPAGARISAGKSGSVDRSLPTSAVSLVNRVPVELHAVTGVAREADHDPVELLDGLRRHFGQRSAVARAHIGDFPVARPPVSGGLA